MHKDEELEQKEIKDSTCPSCGFRSYNDPCPSCGAPIIDKGDDYDEDEEYDWRERKR